METMMTWPSQTRNKIEDSQVMTPLKKYAEVEDGDESVKMLAQRVSLLVLSLRFERLADWYGSSSISGRHLS
jgi:hypothetical protein